MDIFSALVVLIFCGMMAGYYLPALAYRTLYFIPLSVGQLLQKKIVPRVFWILVGEVVLLSAFLAAVYWGVFALSKEAVDWLLKSPIALVCWGVSAIQIVYTLLFRRKKLYDAYTDKFFEQTLKREEQKIYREILRNFNQLSESGAENLLQSPNIPGTLKKEIKKQLKSENSSEKR